MSNLGRGGICRLALAALCCAASLMAARGYLAAQEFPLPHKLQIAGLQVTAWIPDSDVPGPWPILVFSHRYRGCGTQSSFLMEALAGAGYAVFAPNHRDAECGKFESWIPHAEMPFINDESWSDANYADRMQDIENLLNALQHDKLYGSPPFDWTHVGLAGHSLGGYTALELAGAWPHTRDPRVKAVLGLSPYVQPFVAQHTLHGLGAPAMYQSGTKDAAVTAVLGRHDGAYRQTPAPKYLVVIDGVGHLAWTDSRATTKHPLIIEYSRAFFDRYLKGKPFPKYMEEPQRGVADLRFQE